MIRTRKSVLLVIKLMLSDAFLFCRSAASALEDLSVPIRFFSVQDERELNIYALIDDGSYSKI